MQSPHSVKLVGLPEKVTIYEVGARDGLQLIQTGVDLEALCRTSLWMANLLGPPSPSRTVTALASSLEG